MYTSCNSVPAPAAGSVPWSPGPIQRPRNTITTFSQPSISKDEEGDLMIISEGGPHRTCQSSTSQVAIGSRTPRPIHHSCIAHSIHCKCPLTDRLTGRARQSQTDRSILAHPSRINLGLLGIYGPASMLEGKCFHFGRIGGFGRWAGQPSH